MSIFLREGGEHGAPAILLPHGYPCSSYAFRNLIPALADRWHLLAPDFPGFGYSDTPDPAWFGYDFNAYADLLDSFLEEMRVGRFVIYLHDYGSQIGLRLAMRNPQRIAGLIVQNGDIYEDVLGPKYEAIRTYWSDPSQKNHQVLEDAVSEDGFRHEFVGEVGEDIAGLVPPDLWKLHWPLMDTPVRRQLCVGLMEKLEENLVGSQTTSGICANTSRRPSLSGGPRTATCPSLPLGLIWMTCRTPHCTSSMAPATGCSRRISKRRSR